MPPPNQTITLSTKYSLAINASRRVPVTVFSKKGSGAIYYNSESLVSSATKEGELTEETRVTFTAPKWLIAASAAQVELTEASVVATEAASNPTGFWAGDWMPPTNESGTDTTPAEKKLFVSSVFLPCSKTINGIGYLVGSVGGTNKAVAGLFGVGGELLGHSSETTEGTLVGTAKEIQELALTTPYFATGPGTYFIGITMNGGTARLRTIPSNTIGSNLFSKEITITSKNVLAAITPPTAVEQGKGPVGWVY
jgi:hypothetical protein